MPGRIYGLRPRSWINVVGCLAAFFLCMSQSHSENLNSNTWLDNELALLERQATEYADQEFQARHALEQAGIALQLAIKSNNAGAEIISRQAVSIAEDALATAQRLRDRNKLRQTAVKAAMQYKAPYSEFGIAGMIKGAVSRISKTGLTVFDGKSPLLAGDTLSTAGDGLLEIILPDHSRITVGSNSAIQVLKLDPKKRVSTYRLLKGKAYVLRGCLGYALEQRGLCWITHYLVPHADIAVRGTEFSVEVVASGTEVTVIEGEIAITAQDSKKVFKAGQSERLFIANDGAVKGPVPVDSMKRWWEIP